MEKGAKEIRWLGLLCAAVVIVHLSFAGEYGFFRDELYFIACGSHPSFGYVDQPPLTPLLAAASDFLVGGSLFGFRALPALSAGALSFVTGLLVKELGGGPPALLLGAACVALGLGGRCSRAGRHIAEGALAAGE
jgi:4-amino-4-deoxy-L-arabinose transferase-like glycosyltransferase